MGVRWARRPTEIDLAGRLARLEAQVWAVARAAGVAMEAAAKTNAPWTNDTGTARSGLRQVVQRDGDRVIINLCHSVEYGPYLELARGGKHAILWPTIEQEVPLLQAALKGLLA
ncbi:MAG: hypothetical protein WCG26_09955 [Chloroflexales bacterium]